MDLERQAGHPRRRDVAAEAFRLRLGRRVLVVVVEARFADGDHLRVRGEAHDLLERDVELLVRVVGMRADRAVDVGVRLRDGDQLRQLADARRDGDDHADARFPRPRKQRLALLRELREIQVTVVIDEHHAFFFAAFCFGLGSAPGPAVVVSLGLDVAREHALRLGQDRAGNAAGPPRPAP